MELISYSHILTILGILNFLLIFGKVTGFNFDLKYPIIIQNRVSGKIIPSDFGASVKLVKSDHLVNGPSWVIIGAPRGNSTADAHNGIISPGAIWQCSLGHRQEKCRQLIMDPSGNSVEYDGRIERVKDNGGLGSPGGLALDSKNFIACAPRPEKRDLKNNTFYMHGVCNRRRTADIFDPSSPLPLPRRKLIPLEEDPKNEIERFMRSGLAGFSVDLAKSGNELVMGAPGSFKWRGSLIQYLSDDGGTTFTKSYVSDPEKYDKNLVENFNYLGYSVTSGYILEKGKIQYAAGAPRALDFKGKVIIFRFPERENEPLVILREIRGEQPGSYFGSTILALDVNGDGFDDLLVGAPRYSKSLIRSRGPVSEAIQIQPIDERYAEYGDEGVVMLYLSSTTGANQGRAIYIHGGQRPAAQFGTAMVSLGDINKDGYNDFAISAPFEYNSGTVYVYHGGAGKTFQPVQIIKASDINFGLRGFGYSLAGDVDIDNNGFNDIAIGSFNSSQVVILRSKPTITIYGKLQASVKKLPLDIKEFTLQSCLYFEGDEASNDIQLGISLHYDSNARPSRIRLEFSDWNLRTSQQTPFINYTTTISKGSEKEKCTNFHATVINPLEYSGAPVAFTQQIFIDNIKDGLGVRQRTVTIDDSGRFSISGEDFSSFCTTCPSTKPTDVELKLPLAVNCGDDLTCQSDLRLNLEFQDIHEKGFLIGSSKTLVLNVKLSNLKETAIAPGILLAWASFLPITRIPSDCSVLEENDRLITYKCQLGQLLEEGKSQQVQFEFDMASLTINDNTKYEIEFVATATTVSDPLPESDITKTIKLPLYASADPHIEGSRYLEKFNEKTLAPYIVFHQEFEIGLGGPSPLSNIQVIFDLPVNLTTSNGGAVVNVRGIREPNQLECKATKGHFSKLAEINHSSSSEEDDESDTDPWAGAGLVPIERDTSKASTSSFVETERLLIHCDSSFVSCMEVTCQIPLIRNDKAMPLVSFVMDVKSADIRSLMKAHKVTAIQIESKGRLIISELVQHNLPPSTKPDASTAITMIEKEGFKKVSKWVFTIAVVIGLVVLASLIFCLYACGCFDKRKKRPETEDQVDNTEEMKPLNEKDEKTAEEEDEKDKKKKPLYTNDSIDTTDPPEFIPEHPLKLQEEPTQEEDENVTRPSSQELVQVQSDITRS